MSTTFWACMYAAGQGSKWGRCCRGLAQGASRHRSSVDGLCYSIEQAKHVDDTLDVHVSSTETVIEPKLMCACAMPVYQGRLIMVAGARLQERPSLRNSPHHLCDVHHGNRCWVTGAPHDQVLDGILRIQGQLYHIVRASTSRGGLRGGWPTARENAAGWVCQRVKDHFA